MRKFNTIDSRDAQAAKDVIDGAMSHGTLSGYVGSSSVGGPACTDLEQMWEETFGVKFAVAVNSATSGLLAACMALEIGPRDEVIVSPYTMSATAAAPKILGAKIVFADIEDASFGLDPVEVSNAITPNTKAVIVTNLFGHPARLKELKTLCDSHGIYLIEDNAQGIFAKEGDRYTGTIGHIGVFSLNVHKQVQTGEGGVVVANDPKLAVNLRCAMNHGEMRGGIIGLNLRMTEITAAMACVQLAKAEQVLKHIRGWAEGITYYVTKFGLPIEPNMARVDCVSSNYCWTGTRKDRFDVVPPFKDGYMMPLYTWPAFKQNVRCLTAERVEESMILLEICSLSNRELDIEAMVRNLGGELCQKIGSSISKR